ncbi:aldehyde ferredoxin oxidoreductase C-terminal domain-containing protein [Chloroflexota bacterium]
MEAFFLCQRYGLDGRYLSNVLNWLMELYAHGIITAADTDGIPMKWGSPEVIIGMARKLSYREGIGDLLAQGIPVAAKKFGKASEKYLLIIKGFVSCIHSPNLKTRVIGHAVSAIGHDSQTQPRLDNEAAREYLAAKDEEDFQLRIKKHLDQAEKMVGIREAADPRTTAGKSALVRQNETRTAMADLSGVCTRATDFAQMPVDTKTIANFLTLGLGKTVSIDEVDRAGLRMQYLERAFAANLGITRDDDQVSEGYYHRPKPTVKGYKELGVNKAELEKMKDDYYQLMGFDVKTGMPSREGLEKLDMTDVADKLGL